MGVRSGTTRPISRGLMRGIVVTRRPSPSLRLFPQGRQKRAWQPAIRHPSRQSSATGCHHLRADVSASVETLATADFAGPAVAPPQPSLAAGVGPPVAFPLRPRLRGLPRRPSPAARVPGSVPRLRVTREVPSPVKSVRDWVFDRAGRFYFAEKRTSSCCVDTLPSRCHDASSRSTARCPESCGERGRLFCSVGS